MRRHHLFAVAALVGLLATLSALAQPTPIGSVNNSLMGQRVTISGNVSAFRASTYERMPNRLTVTDDSGSVTVVIWPDVFGELNPQPVQGSQVTVDGEVSEYRGEIQVRVADASEVTTGGGTPAATAAAPPPPPATAAPASPAETETAVAPPSGDTTPLASITVAMERQTVTIEGTIESIRASSNPSAPNTLTLRDSSGTGTAVIWPEVWLLLSPQPQQGQRLRGTGAVSEFRGNAQVALRDAQQIQLLGESGESLSTTPAASSGPRPEAEEDAPASTPQASASSGPVDTQIAAIDGTTIGQTVRLQGTVAAIRLASNERAPNTITLTDGTSTIPVVAWADQWSTLSRPPAQGDRVTVTGEVSLYERRNEIQVRLQTLEYQ